MLPMPEIIGYSLTNGALLRGQSEKGIEQPALSGLDRPWKGFGRFSIQIMMDTQPLLDALFSLLPPPDEAVSRWENEGGSCA